MKFKTGPKIALLVILVITLLLLLNIIRLQQKPFETIAPTTLEVQVEPDPEGWLREKDPFGRFTLAYPPNTSPVINEQDAMLSFPDPFPAMRVGISNETIEEAIAQERNFEETQKINIELFEGVYENFTRVEVQSTSPLLPEGETMTCYSYYLQSDETLYEFTEWECLEWQDFHNVVRYFDLVQ